jgi:predicted thioesterase
MSKQVIHISKRFEVTERARKVVSLEAMIAEFERIARELAQQIALEEKRSGVHDPTNARYSTLAKATAQRHAEARARAGAGRTGGHRAISRS